MENDILLKIIIIKIKYIYLLIVWQNLNVLKIVVFRLHTS